MGTLQQCETSYIANKCETNLHKVVSTHGKITVGGILTLYKEGWGLVGAWVVLCLSNTTTIIHPILVVVAGICYKKIHNIILLFLNQEIFFQKKYLKFSDVRSY